MAETPKKQLLHLVIGGEVSKLRRGPALGADTDEVLGELGFDETAIADLRERGIVG